MARLKTRVPILAVQKGLVSLLKAGQSTKIYDDVVPKAKLPYISIGAINAKPNGSKDSAIYDVSVHLHLWSDYQGKFEINSMMNDVATVLSYAPIDTSADGFSIIGNIRCVFRSILRTKNSLKPLTEINVMRFFSLRTIIPKNRT